MKHRQRNHRPGALRPGRPTALLLAVLLVAPILTVGDPLAAQNRGSRLARAQTYLDNGQASEALKLVEEALRKGKPTGEALLLRSTAHIMLGDTEGGTADLRRALELSPEMRQGWLNLVAVELATGHHDRAYEAMLKARDLLPGDPDNDLNLGAILALKGEAGAAAEHFSRFLASAQDPAEGHYLVAGNYALGGLEKQAVTHLEEAVRLNERLRLRARSDNKFVLLTDPGYARLLSTDAYTPPAGALTAAAGFRKPYSRQDSQLLDAILSALRNRREPFDPRIEATDTWALIWGQMRIKISNQQNGTGVIHLSAPAGSMPQNEWARRTQELFRATHENLAP